eukprot:5303183-Amphidinium_carterae.1
MLVNGIVDTDKMLLDVMRKKLPSDSFLKLSLIDGVESKLKEKWHVGVTRFHRFSNSIELDKDISSSTHVCYTCGKIGCHVVHEDCSIG